MSKGSSLKLFIVFCGLFLQITKSTKIQKPPRVEDIKKPLDKIAFGSCNDQLFEQPLWSSIAREKPDLWLWMGDNIYADFKERSEFKNLSDFLPPKMFRPATGPILKTKYQLQNANVNYTQFRSKTPMIGIWDDHDYGLNDGCKTYPFRKESQKEFLDFFEEPADSPRRKQEGIYASYTVGAEDKKVKFILLDNRYHKDPYGTPNGDFLGETQWKWLEKEISSTTSAVAFTVIVSGIQILPNDRFFGGESWSRFPVQRERLLQLLLNSNAKGVILLSGDVHFAELNQVICSNGKNIFTEITSSGMTHSWMQFHAPKIKFFTSLMFTFANMILPWEFRPYQNAFYGFLNWGKIEFDWQAKPPVATVSILGKDEQIKLEHKIFSISSVHSTLNSIENTHQCKPPREISKKERLLWQSLTTFVVFLLFATALTMLFVGLWLVIVQIPKFIFNKIFDTIKPQAKASKSKKKEQ